MPLTFRSAPAPKAVPSPVMTSTLRSCLSFRLTRQASSSSAMSTLIALRRAGRLSVSMLTYRSISVTLIVVQRLRAVAPWLRRSRALGDAGGLRSRGGGITGCSSVRIQRETVAGYLHLRLARAPGQAVHEVDHRVVQAVAVARWRRLQGVDLLVAVHVAQQQFIVADVLVALAQPRQHRFDDRR